MSNSITSFRDEYDYLSNFYEVKVRWDGRTYRNSEAAYQSAKTLDAQLRDTFASLDASSAKRMGQRIPLRADWDIIKTTIMDTIVRVKFKQHPDLAKRLVETGDVELIEGNDRNDTFWGVDVRTGKGENHLGKILMNIRQDLRPTSFVQYVDASFMDDIFESIYLNKREDMQYN